MIVKVLVENLEAHEVLVEQNLAQLLLHNPNECGSNWAAVVEERQERHSCHGMYTALL